MPENEIDQDIHRDHAGWFVRGFTTAALLFAALLYFGGYFGTANTSETAPTRNIIVGK